MGNARDEHEDGEVLAWERQPSEPPNHFRVFSFYLQTRSLRQAYAHASGGDGRKPPPGNITAASQRWRWRERLLAHDLYLAERERAAFEQTRLAARRRRIARLERIGGRFDERLAEMQPKDWRMEPHRLVAAVIATHGAEREELGEDRAEQRTAGDLPPMESRIRPPEPSDREE